MTHLHETQPGLTESRTDAASAYAYRSPEAPQVSARLLVDGTDLEFEMLVGYDEVKSAARDWRRFTSDTPGRVPIPQESDARSVRQLPLETDPQSHTKYRALIADTFSRSSVRRLEPAIRAVVSSVIDAAVADGEVEVLDGLAMPIVMGSLAMTLGRPPEDAEEWASWGRVVFDTDKHGNKSPSSGLEQYLSRVIDESRAEPGSDFFGLLASAHVDGVPLDKEEMLGFGNLVLVGGRGTLIDALTSAIWYLGSEPGDRAKLAAEPSLIPTAVEEFLRYFSPLAHIGRTATTDVDFGTTTAREGTLVSLGFSFANRDPKTFDHPGSCIIDRKPNRHVAFGHGPHTCIGAHLARLEMRVVLEELLRRAPTYRIEPSPGLRFLTLGFASIPVGLTSLHLTFAGG